MSVIRKFSVDRLARTFTAPIEKHSLVMHLYFFEKIKRLYEYKNEIFGNLICSHSKQGFYSVYIVEHIWLGSEGDGGAVKDNKRLSVSSKTIIEFHTHPKHLQHFQNNFSEGDLLTLEDKSIGDIDYKHVLFTKYNILTFSSTGLDIRVAQGSDKEIRAIDQEWQNKEHIQQNIIL